MSDKSWGPDLTLSLSQSLIHSLYLDLLNNFCFHVYAQKSLSHCHTLTLILSHSHTAHWDSIGTFRDSPTDICIYRTLLSKTGNVLNLVMGRKNLE